MPSGLLALIGALVDLAEAEMAVGDSELLGTAELLHLGITGRALEVGEQDRDLLVFAFQGALDIRILSTRCFGG
jgi:hypothetical protein